MGLLLDMFLLGSIMDNWTYYSNTKKALFIGIPIIIFSLFIFFAFIRKSESFIGTDMHYGQAQRDSELTSLKDRTDSLVKLSKGYLPGDRSASLLENFDNIPAYYNPKNYEIEPDYHRTIQQFGIDPNPIESLETPEFMVPKTYETEDIYETLLEAGDNNADAMKLRSIGSTFKNIEKNKFYKDLLKSKCRAGNRSSYKNCGCSAPKYGEH